MNKPSIQIKDFTYNLPEDKIAKYPLENRDDSKLLVFNGDIKEEHFCSISKILPKNSLLVF